MAKNSLDASVTGEHVLFQHTAVNLINVLQLSNQTDDGLFIQFDILDHCLDSFKCLLCGRFYKSWRKKETIFPSVSQLH